jgi:D-xylose transport system substrate-binding protein
MQRLLRTGFALLLTASLALVGCGQTKSTSEGGNTSSGAKKIKIGFSMDTLKEERWQRDRDMFVAKAKELGAEVIVQAANGDDALQVSQAENMLAQGVDILVVVPHNAEATARIVELAHKKNIKVISYDRLIKNSDVDLYISFDNVKVGELQAKAIVAKAPKGNYVYIGGAPTDNNAHLFRQGAMNVLKPLADKGDIKIAFDQFTDEWKPENALKHMENALTALKNDVQAVVAANDGTAGGAIQALAAQKLAGKVPVSGQDAELAALQRIVEGTQTMTVYKPIKLIAETAAQVAVDMAQGKQPSTNGKVNNGKIDVPSILLEPVAVDYNNILSTVVKDGFHKLEDICRTAREKCPKQ